VAIPRPVPDSPLSCWALQEVSRCFINPGKLAERGWPWVSSMAEHSSQNSPPGPEPVLPEAYSIHSSTSDRSPRIPMNHLREELSYPDSEGLIRPPPCKRLCSSHPCHTLPFNLILGPLIGAGTLWATGLDSDTTPHYSCGAAGPCLEIRGIWIGAFSPSTANAINCCGLPALNRRGSGNGACTGVSPPARPNGFLTVYGPITSHFRPPRHLLFGHKYRHEMTPRFQTRREIAGTTMTAYETPKVPPFHLCARYWSQAKLT
jgi:hypothetical protein